MTRKKKAYYPCHKLPKKQWCDSDGLGGFMGHTCIKHKLQRAELSDKEIERSFELVKEKLDIRLIQKHRGAYAGNHETYGIIAEEFEKELLDALHRNDNMAFYSELIDIAVAAILGMASMYANNRA